MHQERERREPDPVRTPTGENNRAGDARARLLRTFAARLSYVTYLDIPKRKTVKREPPAFLGSVVEQAPAALADHESKTTRARPGKRKRH